MIFRFSGRQDEYAARELQALVLTTRRKGCEAGADLAASQAGLVGASSASLPRPPRPCWATRCAAWLRRGWARIMHGRAARRPMWLLCALMFLQQFSGAYVLLFYAVTFFHVSVS